MLLSSSWQPDAKGKSKFPGLELAVDIGYVVEIVQATTDVIRVIKVISPPDFIQETLNGTDYWNKGFIWFFIVHKIKISDLKAVKLAKHLLTDVFIVGNIFPQEEDNFIEWTAERYEPW